MREDCWDVGGAEGEVLEFLAGKGAEGGIGENVGAVKGEGDDEAAGKELSVAICVPF